jgi:cytochrome P450
MVHGRMTGELPPGPRAPAAVQTMAWWSRPLGFFERCRRRYGRRFTIRVLGVPPFVMIAEPDQIRELFITPAELLHAGEALRRLEPLVGPSSVIVLDEDDHLRRRRVMLPALHGEGMARLGDFVTDAAEREISSWPSGQPFETHRGFQNIALEVILRAVFGVDRGERLERLRDLVVQILLFSEHPLLILMTAKPFQGRSGPFGRFYRLRARLDQLIYEQISLRRAEGEEARDDILALLLQAEHEDGSPLSDVEIRDELMSTLIAGHETTASQMAWTLERLSREPRVMRRLEEALDDGDETYLTAVIQEALRRRPVLPNAEPRLLTEPFQLGDWSYPPGVCLVPNPYLVHHDPEFYPDPYAFRPERFLEHPPGNYTWIPFGGGRRRCPGASFAMLEMTIVFRMIFERYRIEPAGPKEKARRRAITVKPRDGGLVRVSRRIGHRPEASVEAPSPASSGQPG